MADELSFDLDFTPEPEAAAEVSPLIRRVVAANPGPFTFKGTCSYVIGRGEVAILDPGPADERHIGQLLACLPGERIAAIVVTHTHRDHSPGARLLKEATGAPIIGCGPHRRSRPLGEGETDSMEGSGDMAYRPDRELREQDLVEGPGWTLEAVETPGHTANHLSFRFREENALFSGDHVMAWSTTIVGPPDGSMSSFMASLDKLRGRPETTFWPGHGGPVRDPQRFVRALIHHRRQREASILNRIQSGDRTTAEIVRAIYQGLAPSLFNAARLSVFAHLEDLVGQGKVTTPGAPQVDGEYHPA